MRMKIQIIILTCLMIASITFIPYRSAGRSSKERSHWNHDYSQTLVMKMALCVVNKDGTANVLCDLDKALSVIEKTDKLTLGVPKIIYLVGWQYNGHDDKYPAFFEVNPALKRPGDPDSRTSLIRFMNEAKKFHTTISLHINMTDAYEDSPLWDEYVKNDLISKNENGSLMVIGNYNNRKAYQVNYRNEWESGFVQKRIDRLLALLPPLKNAGTIHIDAWIARASKGHEESAVLEAEYQKKICGYWLKSGIELTSEWVMDYMTGLIPHYWHFNHRTQADYLKVPAKILTGTHMNPDLRNSDFGLEFLFGTSMYGENVFPNKRNNFSDEKWEALFIKDFYLNFVQYYFLNRLDRLKVEGENKNRVAYFSKDVRVSLADSTVSGNNRNLRRGSTVCFPALWRKDKSLVAYSIKGANLSYDLPVNWKTVKRVNIFLITDGGLVKNGEIEIADNILKLALLPGKPLLIEPYNRRSKMY